jgi:hypothetical protein
MDTDAGAFYGALSSRFSLDASEVILLETIFKRPEEIFSLINNAALTPASRASVFARPDRAFAGSDSDTTCAANEAASLVEEGGLAEIITNFASCCARFGAFRKY